jgi:hypothetical protein
LDGTGQKSLIYVDPTDRISSFNIHTLYSKFFDYLKSLSNAEEVNESNASSGGGGDSQSTSNNNNNATNDSNNNSATTSFDHSGGIQMTEASDEAMEMEVAGAGCGGMEEDGKIGSRSTSRAGDTRAIVYDSPTGAYELLVTMIDKGIPEIIATDGENEQNLFVQASCFTHLLTFLNNAVSNERSLLQQRRLCFGVIRALTHLLRGNSASKQHFKHISGYQHLKTLILRIFQGVPTIEVLNALLNMLVDGTFDRDRSRCVLIDCLVGCLVDCFIV